MRLIYKAFVAAVITMLSASFALADLEDDIRARISPVGEPCVIGQECATAMASTTSGSGEPMDPEMVYQTYCFACHGTGANESPVLGDAEAWSPRISKGLDALYDNAINGFNNNMMPARGLCMDCSDDDVRATVDYMLESVQ